MDALHDLAMAEADLAVAEAEHAVAEDALKISAAVLSAAVGVRDCASDIAVQNARDALEDARIAQSVLEQNLVDARADLLAAQLSMDE